MCAPGRNNDVGHQTRRRRRRRRRRRCSRWPEPAAVCAWMREGPTRRRHRAPQQHSLPARPRTPIEASALHQQACSFLGTVTPSPDAILFPFGVVLRWRAAGYDLATTAIPPAVLYSQVVAPPRAFPSLVFIFLPFIPLLSAAAALFFYLLMTRPTSQRGRENKLRTEPLRRGSDERWKACARYMRQGGGRFDLLRGI